MIPRRKPSRAFFCAMASVLGGLGGLSVAGAQDAVKHSLGERLYLTQCAVCHGPTGEGGSGPALARPVLPRASDDAALRDVIRGGLAGTGMPATRLADAELRELAAYVRKLGQVQQTVLPGDPKRGAVIYQTKAHAPTATRFPVRAAHSGLTSRGASRSPQHLRESLLNPAADVPRGFAFISAVMRDGRTVTGVRINEDTFSIQLRDEAGMLHSLWKAELREFSKDLKKSPMPSYGARLSPSELDDLVAYLASLQEAK